MKSLTSLWSVLAADAADTCCTSALRDINTVSERVKHEGESFLTISLPSLGKSTQKWIDSGEVGINSAFARDRGGRLPRFLGGFFCRVFDRDSGLLLDEPCVASIRAIRQLTLFFGKIELACSPARMTQAIKNYLECEHEVRLFDTELSESDLREFTQMSNMLYGRVFDRVDRDVYYGRLVPKHGPGSTSDGLLGNGKFRQSTWTERLESAGVAAGEHLLPNWRFYRQLEDVHFVEPGSELPVKVCLVPKTMKTPRVIAMEPTCMMYVQQALNRCLLESIKRDDFLSKIIGFDDQVPNNDLARRGSIDTRTATLDLSDASDRVSNQLVRAMLQRWPNFGAAVEAARSRRATLPDGSTTRLAKFASMGSALCFPMEALVFTTLIFMGIQRSLNTSLCRRDLRVFSDSVRIFGDDLIVPTDHVLRVVESLEHFGAKVGSDKSFWTGKFRESCGREYFNGEDVSIVRCRQALPTQLQDATEVQSAVSLRNQLFWSGYWKTCRWLDEQLRELFRGRFPVVESTSSVLGRESTLSYQSEREHPQLRSPLVRGYYSESKPPADKLEGAGALLKCLQKLDTDVFLRGQAPWRPSDTVPVETQVTNLRDKPPEVSANHLERFGRPKSTSIKLGWRSPF